MAKIKKEPRVLVYEPKDLVRLMVKHKLSPRLLESVLARHKVAASHNSIRVWMTGDRDVGFYKWCSVEAALRKEFPPDGKPVA